MNGDFVSVLLWSFLTVFSILLAVYFGYLYRKDGDKRKLMFMLAFAFASLNYIPKMYTPLESVPVVEKLYYWGSLPTLSAVLITVLYSLFRLEDFDRPFKIFLLTIAASIFLLVAPVPVKPLRMLIFDGVGTIVIAASAYLILTRREISDLMFLLSMICFISAGLGLARGIGVEFIVFAYFFAYGFIGLVFATSKESLGEGIASFFALKRELEKTQVERDRAEEALRESEEKYRTLAEQSPNMIFINKSGRVVYANRRCEEIMGYTREEFCSPDFDFLALIAPESVDLVKSNFSKHVNGEDVAPYEYTLITKEGKRIEAIITPKLIRYGKESAILGIITDITERRRMERKLEEYSRNLEELVEERTSELNRAQERLLKSERLAAIGEVATMVGHDLRNPLQSIENATYYLNEELPRLFPSTTISEKAVDMLQVINDSVEYADKIVRDLQDFSATTKPICKKIDVNAIVEETLSQVEMPENVELIMELGHLPEIKVDKDMMKRVFLNLAENGVQAMENGGALKVSTREKRGFVEVSFEDTGVGMSKENVSKLFTPFFTTKAKGMGMGLPICKRFIESHGGNIEARSEEGKGSAFRVRLPVQQEEVKIDET